MSTIRNYENYFRNLAIKSKFIKHIAAAEKDDYGEKEKCRFVTFTSEEVIAGLRSKVSQDASLFLELYTAKGYDNEAGDFRTSQSGRFLVCANKVTTLSDSVAYNPIEILEHTETITWLLINRIIYDANQNGPSCDKPITGITLNNFYNIEPQWDIFDGRYGWLVEFTYQQKRKDEMNPSKQTDSQFWYPND